MALVYFMGEEPFDANAESAYVKIGSTKALSAASRRATCQIGNPRKLVILREMKGTSLVEARFHQLFKTNRVSGEWFALPKATIREILDFHEANAQRLYEHLETRGERG